MEHINNLSVRMADNTEFNIINFIDDIFKAIKNINETSLNASDRAERLYKLSQRTGIASINLI